MFEIANQINNEIDYELAEREYEKYKEELAEEAQREYDREHPIQISNEDYTAMLSAHPIFLLDVLLPIVRFVVLLSWNFRKYFRLGRL